MWGRSAGLGSEQFEEAVETDVATSEQLGEGRFLERAMGGNHSSDEVAVHKLDEMDVTPGRPNNLPLISSERGDNSFE